MMVVVVVVEVEAEVAVVMAWVAVAVAVVMTVAEAMAATVYGWFGGSDSIMLTFVRRCRCIMFNSERSPARLEAGLPLG